MATFEKNISGHLVFEDSRRNRITLEKKYLANYYSEIFNDKDLKEAIFTALVEHAINERGYRARYSTCSDKDVVISDNRNQEDILANLVKFRTNQS